MPKQSTKRKAKRGEHERERKGKSRERAKEENASEEQPRARHPKQPRAPENDHALTRASESPQTKSPRDVRNLDKEQRTRQVGCLGKKRSPCTPGRRATLRPMQPPEGQTASPTSTRPSGRVTTVTKKSPNQRKETPPATSKALRSQRVQTNNEELLPGERQGQQGWDPYQRRAPVEAHPMWPCKLLHNLD